MKEPVKKHNYWWEDLPYIAGFLEYQPDGTYRANMTRKAFVDRWYSNSACRKYGYAGDCKQFQADLEMANHGRRRIQHLQLHRRTPSAAAVTATSRSSK